MLALVLLVEGTVARHPLDFSDPVSLSWRLAAGSARDEAPGCAILGIGDSLVKHAVIPRAIEDRLGARAVNLGVARGPAPATYFLFRRALDAGARPEAVVINFKPSVLIGSPRYNLRYWQEILTFHEALDLTRTGGGGSLLTEIVLGRLLPSIRGRLEVRGAVAAALRGEPSPMRRINRICKRNWSVNGGANVAARNAAFTGVVSAKDHKTLYSHKWYCHKANAVYVRRVLDLAAARGIRVYWLLPPLAPALQARREETGAEAGFLGFVRSLHARYPNLTIVDGRHAGYDASLFVDATHLDGRGAAVLSADLAALLARDRAGRPPGARWVNLPDHAGRSPALALEDVEESTRILASAPENRPARR